MISANLKLKVDEDLYLSPPSPDEASELFELINRNRNHLRKWLAWLDLNTSADDTSSFIGQSLEDQVNGRALVLMIHFQGEIAGVIGFNSIDHQNRTCSIGYWVSHTLQGKGITCKATKSLVRYAFRDLEMNRVTIGAATENIRSRRIPEKLGFRLEGIAKDGEWLYDHFVDLARYAITLSEWNARSND